MAVIELVILFRMCTSGLSSAERLKHMPRWRLPGYTACLVPYLWETAPPRCRYRGLPRTWARCHWCLGLWWQILTLVPKDRLSGGPGPEPEACKKLSLHGLVSLWHGCLRLAHRWWRWSQPLHQIWCTWCCPPPRPSPYGSVDWNKGHEKRFVSLKANTGLTATVLSYCTFEVLEEIAILVYC